MTGAAIPNVRSASTRTLLRINGLGASGGRYGICAGDSGAAIRSSVGVRAVVGFRLNGSNDGLGTTLGAYRPWFERNVIGNGARFCNPNWGLTVRGPASVALSIDGGVVVERRGGGGDIDPWDPHAEESPRAIVASGVRVRVRGADPLEPVARIEAQVDDAMAATLRWPEGR